jgi:hypothetical protein
MLSTRVHRSLITLILLLTPVLLPAAELGAPPQAPASEEFQILAPLFLSSCDCTDFCNEVCGPPFGGIPASVCRPGPVTGQCRSICCCWGPEPHYDCSPWL